LGRANRLPLVRYPAVQEDEPLWRGKAGAANRNGAYGTAFWKKYRIILMNHPDEAEQIAKAGQARTLKDHTIMDRCNQIDEVIQKLL